MAQIDLSTQEMTALLDFLESGLSDLRMEIADTDRKEFRDNLKETKVVLQGIMEKLQKILPADETQEP